MEFASVLKLFTQFLFNKFPDVLTWAARKEQTHVVFTETFNHVKYMEYEGSISRRNDNFVLVNVCSQVWDALLINGNYYTRTGFLGVEGGGVVVVVVVVVVGGGGLGSGKVYFLSF